MRCLLAMTFNPGPPEIRQARESAGLSQAKAAARALVSLRAWIKYESGERNIPAPTWSLFLLRSGVISLSDLDNVSA